MGSPDLGGSAEGVHLEAEAAGDSRIYQAGRDQHIYFPDGTRRVRRTAGSAAGDECPYPGLAAFDYAQAKWFFGRDRLTADLVSRVAGSLADGGLVTVVAPSGAGKSSLLQAGLRHAITQGALPAAGSRDWPHVVFTPTAHPLRNAARCLAALDDSAGPVASPADSAELTRMLSQGLDARARSRPAAVKAVIIVDQFEEVFTLCGNEGERREFIDWLCGLARPPVGEPARAAVVCGLRADFYAECANYPKLREALTTGQVLVGPMSPAELREAVIFPARAAGLDIESGLVELLLRDLGGGSPGASRPGPDAGSYDAGRLPLLAHALQATWQQRHGVTLTVDGYNATGGIRHAIATTAERAYDTLDDPGRDCARLVFLRLVKISDGGDDTRRPLSREELLASRDPADVRKVLDAYTSCRLLTQARNTVEITHEALIRAWPRLRHWIDEDRAGHLVRQDVEEAAAAWSRDRRDAGRLLRGSLLAAARQWTASPGHDLSPAGAALLAASAGHERRAARLRRAAVAALAVSLAVAVTLAVFAFTQQRAAVSGRNQALAERDLAVFNQVSAEALELSGSNTALAANLNLAAYRMNRASAIAARLVSTENMPLPQSLDGGSGGVTGLALSKNGRLMVTSGEHEGFRLWAVAGAGQAKLEYSRPLTAPYNTLDSAALTPDGRLLAVASSGASTFDLWNVADPAHPVDLGKPPGMGAAFADSLAFSPDGRLLASGGSDGQVRLWNVADPARPVPVGGPVAGSAGGFVRAVGFSPDGRLLATGGEDGTLRLWSLAGATGPRPLGQVLAGGAGAAAGHEQRTGSTGVFSLAFSPDGLLLATGDADDAVQLWSVTDPASVRPVGQANAADADVVTAVAFSADGRVLASAGYDGAIRLWDVSKPASPQALGQPLTSGGGAVYTVAFGPGGTMLASGNQDGTARLWALPRTLLTGPTGPVDAVAFSRDKRTLAVASADGTVRLWNVADPAAPSPLGQPLTAGSGTPEVYSVAISPNGRLLAAGSYDGFALWDISDPAHPVPLSRWGQAGVPVGSIAFSPDGGTMAVTLVINDAAAVLLWSLADPARLASPSAAGVVSGPGQTLSVESLAFSPDGRTLASGYTNGLFRLWDVSGSPHGALTGISGMSGTSAVSSLAFTPNGRVLAAGSADGTVRLWNVTSPARPVVVGQPLGSGSANANPVTSVTVSPDGRLLAAGRDNGTVSVWSLATAPRSSVADQTLVTDTNWVNSVAFGPGGTLATGSEDETVQLWNLNVNAAIGHLCSLAGKELTPQQWRTYVPQFPYEPPCSA